MGYSPPKCSCNATKHSSKTYMFLLKCLHEMDENVTHPFPLLEHSLTPSRMPKPRVRKHCFQTKGFCSYRVSVKSIGQSSDVNCWVILRNSHEPLRRELLDNSPRQCFRKSSFEIPFTTIFLFLSCHALTPIVLGYLGAYEMHYTIFIQHMPIYQSCIY